MESILEKPLVIDTIRSSLRTRISECLTVQLCFWLHMRGNVCEQKHLTKIINETQVRLLLQIVSSTDLIVLGPYHRSETHN